MKKILFALTVLVLAFALVGCGNAANAGEKSAEEVLKAFEKEGWQGYLMRSPDLEFGDYKAKEGMIAMKDMLTVSYLVFENADDLKKFQEESVETIGMTMKTKGNAVAIFLGLNEENVKKHLGKMGF